MDETRKALRALTGDGMLAAVDLHVAELICRLAGATADEALLLAAALASHVTTTGRHVCLRVEPPPADLHRFFPEQPRAADRPAAVAAMERVCVPRDWAARLRRQPVVGEAAGDRAPYAPLILDHGRLYLQRFWRGEQKLAGLIRDRLNRPAPARPQLLARVPLVSARFAAAPTDEPDWQQVAVAAAVTHAFCVICGGPGSGKTTVAAAILALLLEDDPELKIAICAPTGKAQARLREAIVGELPHLVCSDAARDRLARLRGVTVHRLLGARRGSPHCRHDADHPLDADVVVLDEASMVSPPLMAKLLEATPAGARVILLGDKDQLASVESGAVLGDICAASQLNRFSADFAAAFTAAVAGRFPPLPLTSTSTPLADCTVELRRSHRFKDTGGIGALRLRIHAGAGAEAVELLAADGTGEVAFTPVPPADKLEAKLRDFVAAWRDPGHADAAPSRFREYPQAASVAAAFGVFERFRILCSHRGGPYGVEAVNHSLRRIFGLTGAYVRGLPLMITANDYSLRLFNGDIGLCWTDAGGMKVFFPDPEPVADGASSRYRAFLPTQLPQHEVVFAMTVHKAQGSGFDRVLLLLPDADGPLLTRELIYTGVTRARRRVDIWAGKKILAGAVRRRTERLSGLTAALLHGDTAP